MTCNDCGRELKNHKGLAIHRAHRHSIRADKNANQRRYRREDPERYRTAQICSEQKHPENKKAAMQRWNASNPERRRAYLRKHYQRHREQVLAANRRWKKRNPDRVRAIQIRRRARKQAAQGSATAEQIRARVDFFGGRCWMCGKPWMELDHVIPLA